MLLMLLTGMWGLCQQIGARRMTAIQPSAHLHGLCSHTTSPRQGRRRGPLVPSNFATLHRPVCTLRHGAIWASPAQCQICFLQAVVAPSQGIRRQGRRAKCHSQGSVRRWRSRSSASESLQDGRTLVETCRHTSVDGHASGSAAARQCPHYMATRRYNAKVFGGKLPADLQITWSKTLCTTAGLTHYSRSTSAEGGGQWKCAVRLLIHAMCGDNAWLLTHRCTLSVSAVWYDCTGVRSLLP